MKTRITVTAMMLCLALLASCSSDASETTGDASSIETTEYVRVTLSQQAGQEASGYTHGEDGYFCLPEMGYATEMKLQQFSTCWAYSSATAAESNYIYTNGEYIVLDPMAVADKLYQVGFSENQRGDGIVVPPGSVRLSFGGLMCQTIDGWATGNNGYYLVDAKIFDDQMTVDEMKAYVQEYGGIKIGICTVGTKFYSDIVTLNSPDPAPYFDHALVVVGWDDNFPAELFEDQPSQDGAWILQDSSMGTSGFLYMSYESEITEPAAFIVSDEYHNCISNNMGDIRAISTGDTTTIANIFSSDEDLRGIGLYYDEIGEDVVIEIYTADFSRKILALEEHVDYPGYHVTELSEPLEPGEYAVAVTYNGSAPVEGDILDMNGVRFRPDSNPGESFVLVDGEWVDTNDPDIQDILEINFNPNNVCINALY